METKETLNKFLQMKKESVIKWKNIKKEIIDNKPIEAINFFSYCSFCINEKKNYKFLDVEDCLSKCYLKTYTNICGTIDSLLVKLRDCLNKTNDINLQVLQILINDIITELRKI